MSQTRRRFLRNTGVLGTAAMVSPLWAKPSQYDVLIIGAGLAGMHCANLLRAEGARVAVLEASQRVGGRVYTADDLPGKPEMGASQVGMDYSEMRQLIARYQLPLGAGHQPAEGMSYAIDGKLFAAEQWSAMAPADLNAVERQLQPNWLLWNYLNQGVTLDSALQWLDPAMAKLDIPLAQHLRQLGASEQAIQLMNLNFMGEDVEQVSALHMLRKNYIVKNSRGAEFIQGGTQRLPDAMAAELGDAVFLNKAVAEIADRGSVVSVRCQDGEQLQAKRLVLAAPFSTIRDMRLSVSLSAAKQQAISQLPYSSATHVFFQVDKPYWEQDGLSPNMWTDTELGMVFTQLDEQGEVTRVRAWLMGLQAQKLDGLPDQEIAAVVSKAFAKHRPSTKGALSLEKVFSWKKTPYNKGAFSYFNAGDITRFAADISQAEGRVHFAGEHTEFKKSGMEAALLSGRRSAEEVVSLL